MRLVCLPLIACAVALAGCAHDEGGARASPAPVDVSPAPQAAEAPTAGPAPEEIVRRYYQLASQGRFADARKLWRKEGAGVASPEEIELQMTRYEALTARVGVAAPVEGAAGSLSVAVPVDLDGRVRGEAFRATGKVTLRRCNDVSGCAAADRAWGIEKEELTPVEK